MIGRLTSPAGLLPRLLPLLLLLGTLLAYAGEVRAEAAVLTSRPPALAELSGETLRYGIDFLIFTDIAEGVLTLQPDGVRGRYRAELVARTLGVASWLSGDRVQRYVSVMEAVGGGVRSVSYESSIRKQVWGRWRENSKRYRFDYRLGTVRLERGKDGVVSAPREIALPAGSVPVDVLTGFYNLRLGVYGPLEVGRRLQIATVTSDGVSSITVEVLAAPPPRRRSNFPSGGTLLEVTVSPEIFDTRGATVYVWFDAAGRPARGIVENVIGLGDAYGHLREEGVAP